MRARKIKIFIVAFMLIGWGIVETKALDLSEITMDDGTCPDGTMLIPKAIAMHCGISCEDATDPKKINECLNMLAKSSRSSGELQEKITHQLSKEYLEKAMQFKAISGNYEERQDELLEEGEGSLDLSPSTGGATTGEGSDLRKKQEKSTKLIAQTTDDMAKILDIYSSKINLEFVDGFYNYDAPYRNVDD